MPIDASLFAHIENDASLTGTYKLQGNRFVRTVDYLTRYLEQRSRTQKSFSPEYATLLEQMKYLVDIEQKMESMSSGRPNIQQDVHQLAREIADNIIKMPPDGKVLIPGGWHNSDGGHAMVYEFTPQKKGFNFSAINAGAGIEYHAKKSNQEKELFNPKKTWHVPDPTSHKDKDELINFIERLLKARLPVSVSNQTKPITEKVLYEEIFPTISYINGVEVDANKDIPAHAFTGGQLSGTCAQRCIHQMLKILSKSEQLYQEFILDFKQHALVEYANLCIKQQQPYNPAVADQIRLAIENNLKILNTPGLFDESKVEHELEKITELEHLLSITAFDPEKALLDNPEPDYSFYVARGTVQDQLIQFDKQHLGEQQPQIIQLGDGTNLLANLNQSIRNIRQIEDPAIKYNYLEKLLLELPLHPVLPNNQGFYRELTTMDDFRLLTERLNDIQTLFLDLQKNWLNGDQHPKMNLMLLSIASLQISAYTVIPSGSNLPSFLQFSNAMMQSLVGNQARNPFYATNDPVLDQRLKDLQEHYKNSYTASLGEYHSYLKDILLSEPELNNELSALYDAEFGTNKTELHDEIRKAGLKSLYLIARHYDNTKRLDFKFNPIINKIVAHMEHESKLRKVINPLYSVQYKDSVWIRLSIDYNSFRVSSPLFPSFIPYEELVAILPDSKYNLKGDSPAKTALEADISKHSTYYKPITPKSANKIQLQPGNASDDPQTMRRITQADIVARDYLHLRSVPDLQIPLTLDYFKRHIDKLSDESNQRYVEANIFQPGLLLTAVKSSNFLPQFDGFLKTGLKFFTVNGQHTRDSLLFLRLDFLVSRYLTLNKNPEGLNRLKTMQFELEKQLSLPNEPEVIYVMQQYLFLSLVERMEMGEQSDEIFNQAYKAYYYINSHTNPLILEDKAFKYDVDCTVAKFKSLISKQPRVKLQQTINKLLVDLEQVTEQDLLIDGQFPVFTVNNLKAHASYQFNAIQGKLFEKGWARSGIPLSIQNHPLMKELGLTGIKECLMNSDRTYMILSDKVHEIKLYYKNNDLTVQKNWIIQGKKTNYELKALSTDHEASHATKENIYLYTDLPSILTDGTMNYWCSVSNPSEGILVRNNIPVYSFRNNEIWVLDSDGKETGNKLSDDTDPLLLPFESKKFILNHSLQNKTSVRLPRYNLNFEYKHGTLVKQDTGEQVLKSPKPIHSAVAGLVLANKDRRRFIVPIARFYAVEKGAKQSDFYPVVHDISGTIAAARLEYHWKNNPITKKPLWDYSDSEHYVSFQLKNGEPIADTVSDALYLAYIYMATNQTEKAWKTLEECNTRLGGLTGDPSELKYIAWICNEMPHLLPSDQSEFERTKPTRDTPPYVACKLKAMSLLCDYMTQNGKFDLPKTTPTKDTANSVHDSLSMGDLEQFQSSLPDTIYSNFTRLQTMRRHMEHTYDLSSLERKRLLNYYHQSQPADHAPQGALGFEWMNLSLEALLEEQETIRARYTSDKSLSKADEERLKLIQTNLKKLKPVVAKSTILEQVSIDLSLPLDSTINKAKLLEKTTGQMDLWLHKLAGENIEPVSQIAKDKAIEALSSKMTDDEFIVNFPAYLQIACAENMQYKKELYDFCSQTLIAKRHVSLKDQDSNIPLLSNILYRLLNNKIGAHSLRFKTVNFKDLVSYLSPFNVPPLNIYQAKDVYQEILATPEQLMVERKRPKHAPLKATPEVFPSLIAQTGLEKLLKEKTNNSKKTLDRFISQYKVSEKMGDEALEDLAKSLTKDLDQTFEIEEQAGKILFALEQRKKEIAGNLIQDKTLMQDLLAVTKSAAPLLKDQINKSWKAALALANQGPDDPAQSRKWAIERKSKARATLTKADLLSMYSRSDFAYSVQKTGLSLEKIQQLHDLTHKALIQGIQAQSVKKIRDSLKKASRLNDITSAAQALDVLARTEIPGIEEPSIVILQHEEQILLRKRQASALKSLLKQPKDGRRFNETIEKIIPGGGKSKVILPILAEKKAQGDNLVVVEVPQALLATNHVDLNSTSQRLFGKRAYRFDFNRDSDCSPENLEQMYKLFVEIMSTRSYMVTTAEAIQSLELKYIELLLSTAAHDETWEKQVFWCDKINNLFRYHADCIIDEVHQGLSIKKKLNYTSGEPKPISPDLIKNAIALFGFINLDLIKEAPSFDDHYDWSPFKTDLATKLVSNPNSPLAKLVHQAKLKYGPQIQDTLIAYLCNKAKTMPEAVITASEEDKEALAFFKQEINVRLPQTLPQKLDKNYGPSKRNDLNPIEKTVAIPYAGTNVPNERNRYQDNLEAINKTIQMMLLKGINEDQLIQRVSEWEALAREELFRLPPPKDSTHTLTIDDTPTAQGFALLTSGLGIRLSELDSKNIEQMRGLHQRLKSNIPLIFDFLREFALKQIKQDKGILSSDCFNHVDQYRTVQGVSGTPPWHDPAYHQRLSYDKSSSLGSDGYIFEIIRNKQARVSSCDYENAYQFIDYIITKSNERTRAIIDIRGTFTGITNLEIAKEIARYIRTYPGHFSNPIKQVLYFDENQILCALDVNNPDKTTELKTSDVNELNRLLDSTPAERFTLYDQIHTLGTDIKQYEYAHALVLVDDKTTMLECLQGAMRERELELHQTNEFFVPERLSGISLDILGEKFRNNDKHSIVMDSPAAAEGQMRNCIRRKLLSLIQDIPSEEAEKKAALIQHFRPLFEDTPQLNIFALYGGINKKEAIAGILGHYKDQMQNLWKTRLGMAGLDPLADEIQRVSTELQGIIEKAIPFCLPEYDAIDNSFSTEVEVQKEVQKEVQIEVLALNETYNPALKEQPQVHWPYYLDWENLVQTSFLSGLNKVCERDHKPVNIFSENLLASSNFKNTYQGQIESTGAFMKPVFLIWYHLDKGQLKAVLITPQEEKDLQSSIRHMPGDWISTTEDTVIAGKRPDGIIDGIEYQSLREQVRFFNGEFSTLSNQDTPLIWLQDKTVEKLDFFEHNLLPYRPGNEAKVHQLKTALTQAKSEGFEYIANHPFQDLSQFNWVELYPNILPTQALEYQKFAQIFVYLTENWNKRIISIDDLQQQFHLPMNSLIYVAPHLKHLTILSEMLTTFESVRASYIYSSYTFIDFVQARSQEEKSCLELCLGMTLEKYYELVQFVPDKPSRKLSEELRANQSIHSIHLLGILNSYPALKGKNLFNRCFEDIASEKVTKDELHALMKIGNPSEHMVRTIIYNNAFDDSLMLAILETRTDLPVDILNDLVSRCQSNVHISKLLEQVNINQDIVQKLLAKDNLNEDQLLSILKRVTDPDDILLVCRHPSLTPKIITAILAHLSISRIVVQYLLDRHELNAEQLLLILNLPYAREDNIIHQLLTHRQLNEQGLIIILKNHIRNEVTLDLVFQHPLASPQIRKDVLSHPLLSYKTVMNFLNTSELSDDELLLILKHPSACNEQVRTKILKKPHLNQQHLIRIFENCTDDNTLENAFNHPSADKQTRLLFLQHQRLNNSKVLLNILKEEDLSEEELRVILTTPNTNKQATLELIFQHPLASTQIRKDILVHPLLPYYAVMNFLNKSKLSDDELLLILKHPSACNEQVRIEILKKSHLNEQHLIRIFQDCTNESTLERIFQHPFASDQIRREVLIHPLISYHALMNFLSRNELTDDELLLILKHSPACNERVRTEILKKSHLTEDHLILIFRDCTDKSTLELAFSHPSADKRTRLLCLQHSRRTMDSHPLVLKLLKEESLTEDELLVILKNPNTCNETIRQTVLQLQQVNKEHLRIILENCTSEKTLEEIYNHPLADSVLCEQVLAHPALSSTVILNLVSNKELTTNEINLILRHPTACNEFVFHALLLTRAQINEDHLLEILAKCQTEETVEQVYNHPVTNSKVRERLLEHPLVFPSILINMLKSKKPTDRELMLVLKNPIVRKDNFLYPELNKLELNEDHFNEILNNHSNNEAIRFIFRHKSATPEIRERILQRPNLPIKEILRHNVLTKNEFLVLLKNQSISNSDLVEISKIPSIEYEVLLAIISHNKIDDLLLYSAINHRLFDINAATIILNRARIPDDLLIHLARRTFELADGSEHWEQCAEQLMKKAQNQVPAKEMRTLIQDNVPRLSTKITLKLLRCLGQDTILHVPLLPLIQKATHEDLDTFISLNKKYTHEELCELARKNLDSSQIDRLLSHKSMTATVADILLFSKPAYSGKISAWDWLDEDLLLRTLDKTNDYDSLKLALRHGNLLSESTLNQWLENKREQQLNSIKLGLVSTKIEVKLLSILEELRLKSITHAIKAVNNPKYEKVAETSFKLYQTLLAETKLLAVNPRANSDVFKKNCMRAIDASKPILEKHRGYKQFFLDFINVLFVVTALFRNGNWRLFEAKTDSMNTVNNVLERMEDIIENNNKGITSAA